MKMRPITLTTSTPRAVGGLDQIAAPRPGVPGGIIGGADQPRLALDEDQRLALIEGVVAERHRVDAGGEELLADRLGDAEAAGGVLAVDDDEIEPPARAQERQPAEDRGAPRAPDHVADEQQPHQRASGEDRLALGQDEIEASGRAPHPARRRLRKPHRRRRRA